MRGSPVSRSSKLSNRMGKSFGIGSRCLFQVAMSRYIRELSILSIAKYQPSWVSRLDLYRVIISLWQSVIIKQFSNISINKRTRGPKSVDSRGQKKYLKAENNSKYY